MATLFDVEPFRVEDRSNGRPPAFTGPGGTSRTNVRIRLTKEQWAEIEQVAHKHGMSFRTFLKTKLLKSLGLME